MFCLLCIGFQRHTPAFSFVLGASFEPVGYAVDLAQNLVDQLAQVCRCPLSILPIETTSATREPTAGWHFEFRGRPSIGEAFDAYRHNPDIDGLIADEMILFGLLDQVGDEITLVHEQRLGSEEYGFMLRQSDRELLEAFDQALEKSLGSGPFMQRLSRWSTPVTDQSVALASLCGNSVTLHSLPGQSPKA